MKSSDILRYLISFISKLLYLQWFFGFGEELSHQLSSGHHFQLGGEPLVRSGGGAIDIVLVFVLCACQPVAGYREGIEVLLPSGAVPGGISCGELTVFSLADTLAAFFAF